MGYTLAIGEAVFEGCKEDAYLRVWARSESHKTAPTFLNDEMTKSGNTRSPSYAGWAEFCRSTGLYGMFFGVDGSRPLQADPNGHRDWPILADHPGYAALNDEDEMAVRHALERHVAEHGELEPGFRSWNEKEEDAPPNALACATRARLLWLHYWTKWAVENCEHPVLVNS